MNRRSIITVFKVMITTRQGTIDLIIKEDGRKDVGA
jgi:hypothetical protein